MVNELRAVVGELGGKQGLGRALASESHLREAIREGFPPRVVAELMHASGLTLKELAGALDLSARSLQRHRRCRKAGEVTNPTGFTAWRESSPWPMNTWATTSERLRWLKRSNRALGGLAPGIGD